MARYQQGNFGFRTIELHEKKDPLRNLWRNVLIVGIEDLLKKKEIQIKFNVQQKYSLEEMWFNHEDFDLICISLLFKKSSIPTIKTFLHKLRYGSCCSSRFKVLKKKLFR